MVANNFSRRLQNGMSPSYDDGKTESRFQLSTEKTYVSGSLWNSASDARQKKVLLAIDNETIREQVSKALSTTDYSLALCRSAIEFLELLHNGLEREQYQLLIVQLAMPPSLTYELLEYAQRVYGPPPILLIEPRVPPESGRWAALNGVKLLSEWPVEHTQLLQAVAGLLPDVEGQP